MNNLPPMTMFDYMVSSRENNMLKAFLPYIDKDFQPMLATYIKYTELMATIDLFRREKNVFDCKSESPNFTELISSMLPYVSPEERETFETINNIKNAMDMFETYKDMFAQDATSDNTSDTSSADSTDDNSNMSDIFSSMLSPEQQLMFEQFSSMMNN